MICGGGTINRLCEDKEMLLEKKTIKMNKYLLENCEWLGKLYIVGERKNIYVTSNDYNDSGS